mmetsp:Transcript_14751/g.21967  ORF Transcript_14751/g.21967 Transcript_14751/m.21967 type:complete len:606 (-) Transcript_14751:118-1935(-)
MKVKSFFLRLYWITIPIFASLLPSYKSEASSNYNNGQDDSNEKIGTKIAIIGGGIAGSFTAKYLADYDTKSAAKGAIDSIVVFDPFPIEHQHTTEGQQNENLQGGRVSSLTLDDGTVVELGGATIHDADKLLIEMIEGDPNLVLEKSKFNECVPDKHFGIYDGDGSWSFLTNNAASSITSWFPTMITLTLLWRYNIDFIRIWQASLRARESFHLVYKMLDTSHPASFFHSINELWDIVGLLKTTHVSYDDFLDAFGLEREVQWWRRFIPGQGCLREELLTAMNICYSNQLNPEMNGLSGLINLMSLTGETFSINGGNQQLISSAFMQAQKQYESIVNTDNNENLSRIRHVQAQITTVVSDMNSMGLWSEQRNMGKFDIVILAAPLQNSQISFFTKSHFDEAVLHSMPMHGMVDSDVEEAGEHHRQAKPLPPSATNDYTEVITTIVSSATVKANYVGLADSKVPTSIYVTEKGRRMEGINEISCLAEHEICKVLSPQRLSTETLENLFGPNHKIEHVKVWGGDFGGFTPNYNGGREHAIPTPFLLYDGGLGTKGLAEGSALYYVNSVEASIASMEASAIGAKSVAKLIAQRLGLMSVPSSQRSEEL